MPTSRAGACAVQSSVSLNFVPGLAHYSTGLDKVVLTSTNPHALRIVDPFAGMVRSVPLPAAVKSFNLSADGKLAAVLHEGVVSLIDIDAGTLIRSTATGGSQTDAFVTNAGIVFLIGQTGGQWVSEPWSRWTAALASGSRKSVGGAVRLLLWHATRRDGRSPE